MTVFLENDPELTDDELLSIKSSFLRVIRNGMNSQIYSFGDIEETIFVGTRAIGMGNSDTSPSPKQSMNEDASFRSSSSSDSVRVGVLASALSAVLLLGALFVVRKVRSKKMPADASQSNNIPLSKQEEEVGMHSSNDTKSAHSSHESPPETSKEEDKAETTTSKEEESPASKENISSERKKQDPIIENMTISFDNGKSLLSKLDTSIDSSEKEPEIFLD
jgi:hypothetical protein